MTIGTFDSGLGGLTGYAALRRLLPDTPLVYFGDNARVPYGTKSKQVICRYAKQDARFLLSLGVEAILIACGTVSSNALAELEDSFSVPFVGVVQPAAKRAASLAAGGNGRVLVLGTAATVRSGAYETALHAIDPSLRVETVACPLFVPLVENGHVGRGDIAATAIAKEYLDPFADFEPDAVILGCTHFPLLSGVIADVLPGKVLVSAGEEAAIAMAKLVGSRDKAAASAPLDCFYTSDDPDAFRKEAATFLGAPVCAPVETVEIESYEG